MPDVILIGLAIIVSAACGWPITALVLAAAEATDARVRRSTTQPLAYGDRDVSPESRLGEGEESRLGEGEREPETHLGEGKREVEGHLGEGEESRLGEGESEPDSHRGVGEERTPPHELSDEGLLRGGGWIGLLERGLITGGILVGHPEIIAIVVAVKGLGRFPELRTTRAAGEKFIIGTFSSVLVASAVALLTRWLWL